MQQQKAIVTATYSRRMRLRLANDEEVNARIKGKRLRPVCGDRVIAEPIADESDWLIIEIEARDNALSRPNMRGQTEVLAANIELLLVVAAGEPTAAANQEGSRFRGLEDKRHTVFFHLRRQASFRMGLDFTS